MDRRTGAQAQPLEDVTTLQLGHDIGNCGLRFSRPVAAEQGLDPGAGPVEGSRNRARRLVERQAVGDRPAEAHPVDENGATLHIGWDGFYVPYRTHWGI